MDLTVHKPNAPDITRVEGESPCVGCVHNFNAAGKITRTGDNAGTVECTLDTAGIKIPCHRSRRRFGFERIAIQEPGTTCERARLHTALLMLEAQIVRGERS